MTATSVLQPTIARCGVCDVVTVATSRCAQCGEPVCLTHTRLAQDGDARYLVCAVCHANTTTPAEA